MAVTTHPHRYSWCFLVVIVLAAILLAGSMTDYGQVHPPERRRRRIVAMAPARYQCHCTFSCPDHAQAWLPSEAPPSERAANSTFNESVHRRDFRFDCPLRGGLCSVGEGERSADRPLAALILPSAPGNGERRDAARETWISEARGLGFEVVFLLALSPNPTVRRAVDDESRRHGDMVVTDFIDSYNLLTVKSVAMLRWASLNCPSARYLVKVDDDMFLSLPNLRLVLLRHADVPRVVIGHRHEHGHVIMSPKHKWHDAFYLRHYGRDFPPYAVGGTYAIAMAIVPELFAASQAEPFDRMEDVFTTGICAKRIGNVTPVQHAGFWPKRRQVCDFVNRDVISGHKMTAEDMRAAWRSLKSNDCMSSTSRSTAAGAPAPLGTQLQLPPSTSRISAAGARPAPLGAQLQLPASTSRSTAAAAGDQFARQSAYNDR